MWAAGGGGGGGSSAVVFVVTDIEGSTQLSAAAGQALYAKLQEIHDSIMREAISRHGGLEVTTEGDRWVAPMATSH
jgi:class 3 adenylate cyclase